MYGSLSHPLYCIGVFIFSDIITTATPTNNVTETPPTTNKKSGMNFYVLEVDDSFG